MPVANDKLKKFKAKDPSRTIMLRRQMLRDIGARMERIKRAVYQSIAINDDLGLRGDNFAVNEAALVVNDRWRFLSNPQKVTAFQDYLKQLVDTELLSAANPAAPWTDKYIASAYKQGLTRGFLDSKQAYSRPSSIEPGSGTVGQFLEGSFASPESVAKLELLGTRTFTNLKGISAAMDQQLSNTLVLGLAEGRAPGAIAKQMSDQIDGITRQRANTIARTEIIYAHAEGQLDSMKAAGVYEVIVMAEWATAGDANVCSQCSPLQGVIFTVDEARGMIPRHPNCVLPGNFVEGQIIGGLEARYAGQAVVVLTASGHEFAVTVDHPVFAEHGPVPAGQLYKGQKCLTYKGQLEPTVAGVNVDHEPALIEHVVASLGGPEIVMPANGFDFKADPGSYHGSVNVKRRNVGLATAGHPSLAECVDDFAFMPANHPSVSFLHAEQSFCSIHGSPHNHLGLRLVASGNTTVTQHTADEAAVVSKQLSHKLNRTAIGERSHNGILGDIAVLQPHCLGMGAELDVAFSQPLGDGGARNPDFVRDLLAAFPGKVLLDEIVDVRFFHYVGPVYDLETVPGYFMLNDGSLQGGVLVQNCRCAWLPAAVGEDQKGQAWSDRQSKVLDSIKDETGLDDGKAAREKSRWLGADKKLPNSLTGFKPKGSALKEAAAEAKLNKLKEAKLAVGKANAAKQAAEEAAKRTNIKLGLAQSKLEQAGITTDLTEFTGGNITDSLAAKILTDASGELLVSSEEFLQLVAAAKAESSPVGQVGALLEKRAAVLAARKQAARAAAAQLAKETELQAAKAAMRTAGGLGEGSFTAEGMLTPQATHAMATELNLTSTQLEALANVGTASEQAAVVESVVTEAKAANTAYLQKAAAKYGIDPQKLAHAAATGDPADVWDVYLRAAVGEDIKYFDWVKDKAWEISLEKTPVTNLVARLQILENGLAKYKAAIIKTRENWADKTTAKLKKLGGGTYKAALKKLKKGVNDVGEFIGVSLTKDHTYDEVVMALGRIGADVKAMPDSFDPLEIFLVRKGDPDEILKSIQKANFKDTVTVVKYQQKLIAISGESEVYAAQLSGVEKIETNFFDMDAWLAAKKAGSSSWLDTNATFSHANAMAKVEQLAAGNAAKLKWPLEFPDKVDFGKYQNAKKAANKIAGNVARLDSDVLHAWTSPNTGGMADALDFAKKSAATTPLDNPWPGVHVMKWNGKYYVTSGQDVAAGANLAGVDKLSVILTDMDAAVGVPAALNPASAFPTTTKTVAELLGTPKPGEMMTVSQYLAKYPGQMGWIKENGKTGAFHAFLGEFLPGFKKLPLGHQRALKDVLGKASSWSEQVAVVEMFKATGVAVPYDLIGATKVMNNLVPLEKLVGKTGHFLKPGLTKIAKVLKIPDAATFVDQTYGAGDIKFQLKTIIDSAPAGTFPTLKNNMPNLVIPADVNDVSSLLDAVKAAHGDLAAKWKIGAAKTYGEAQAALESHIDFTKISVYDFWSVPNEHANTPGVILAKLEKHIADDPTILKRVKYAAGKVPTAAPSPVVPAAGPLPTTALPDFKKIKVIKALPGSTNPQLVESTTDASKWVMKAGLDPGHVRSEALADDLYRRAGFAVPQGGIVDTTGGPVKFSEFLDGGTTLQEYLRTATGAQKAAAMEQVKSGFVMDALLANHDVGGLSMDNLFVVGEKVYRIDNGGALLYRAQGAAKADFKAVVKEFKTMRDPKVNSVTAELYKGITDKEIYAQIRDIVAAKDELLAAVPDAALRATLGQRIDWLQAQLPQPKVDAALRVHTAASKAPALYEVDEVAINRIKKAKVNGVTLSGNHDLIEDNNILIWEEIGNNGQTVTRAALKISSTGAEVVGRALPGLTQASLTNPATGVVKHPGDVYYENILSALKTANVHANDGAYNMGTVQVFKNTLKDLHNNMAGADASTKAMLDYYKDWANKIEDAMSDKKVLAAQFDRYLPPAPKAKAVAAVPKIDAYKVTQAELGDRVNTFKDGAAVAANNKQSYSHVYGANKSFTIDDGAGVKMHYTPPAAGTSNGGGAWAGRMVMEVDGPVSPETIQKFRSSLGGMGIDAAAPSAAAEEAVYIHKTIYMTGRADMASYKAIWDNPMPAEEKVLKLKAWVKSNMGVTLPDVPTANYNPAGTMNTAGNGYRIWNRWDVTPQEAKTIMGNRRFVHYVGGNLSNSDPGDLAEVVPKLLASGGELTSSMNRVRKGVPTRIGSSVESDMGTGGADYIFTRVMRVGDKSRGQHGLFFKPELAARADAVSYAGDRYGDTKLFKERAKDITTMTSYGDRSSSNETVFKHGLSIIDDIDTIGVSTDSERLQVIKAYKDAGIVLLPDGRRVADIVKVQ